VAYGFLGAKILSIATLPKGFQNLFRLNVIVKKVVFPMRNLPPVTKTMTGAGPVRLPGTVQEIKVLQQHKNLLFFLQIL